MRIIALSDLHGILPHIKDEGAELMLICGDIVPLSFQSDMELSKWWFETKFTEWVNALHVDKVVFICGNHDWLGEWDHEWLSYKFSQHTKATYLHHQQYNYISLQDGKEYKIFGTPYCKIFGRWAFMRENETLEKLYSEISENLDILLTHDAPYGVTDICNQGIASIKGHIGNIPLREALLRSQPMYCFHGHLHSSSRDFESLNNTKVCNCSVLDEYYDLVYKPIVIDI